MKKQLFNRVGIAESVNLGTENTSFDLVDLFKLLASLLIFVMHFNALEDFGEINFLLEFISAWAVPFFFVCSGFFLFDKGKNGNINREMLIRYVKRIALLYGTWFIVNLPYVFYKRLYEKGFFLISTWLDFLRNALLSSTFIGSWFLTSSIFSAWFVYMLSKRLKTKSVIAICSVLYSICIMSSMYEGLIPSEIINVISFLCFPHTLVNGCLYFALGKYISEKKGKLMERFSRLVCCGCMLFSYCLFGLEVDYSKSLGIYQSTAANIAMIPFAFFLLIFCLQSNIKITNAKLCRRLSTIIYCCQADIVCLWAFTHRYMGIESSVILFLLALVVLMCVCFGVLILQKKTEWRWCQYLT